MAKGQEVQAYRRSKTDGADHVFYILGRDVYVASGKAFPALDKLAPGTAITVDGKAGKVIFPVNAPNSFEELREVELPKILKRTNASAGLGWAAMFGMMGGTLGLMAGGGLKAALIGATVLPGILVGLPMIFIGWLAYQELKAKANPPLTALDEFGEVQ